MTKPTKLTKSIGPLLLASAVVAVAALAARPCRASGFLIYDLSGEAMGRGSAVSASVNEPAAVWFNPAALPYMRGVSASAGGVFITARSSFTPAAGGADTTSQRGNFFLPTLFANASISDRLAVGMGVYTAFGIGIHWPDDWMGRENGIAATLQSLTFNPTVAFKILPQLSVAVGFDAVRGTVDFITGLPAIVGGEVRLVGGTWGYGGNAAVLYRIVPNALHVALTYRSRVKLKLDNGTADFDPGNPEFLSMIPDQNGTAEITLPDIITAGVVGHPRADLALSFDANLVLWSTYGRVDINFVDRSDPTLSAPAKVLQPQAHDTFTLRGGADWSSPVRGLHLRGGLIYDRSALDSTGVSPGLPDADRYDLALGVGYGNGRLRADLGYLLVYFRPSQATSGRESPEGTYNTLAHLIGLTLAANWR
jgi:long-chain fatty acid transport protein